MNLQAFFAQHSTTDIQAVAEQAGTSLAYLRNCKYGQRQMSADLAIWLEHVTNGELTARELRPDLPWPESFPAVTAVPHPAISLPEVA
ncbi:MAG: transcriptional regulator [Candidatus Competibacteraceae bacterium]|jgi:DNA-binding transcriptional regulator YdaS (Cro superfamily)